MKRPSSPITEPMECAASEFRAWQERTAADPVRQEWERWQGAKRQESVAGWQSILDLLGGGSALEVNQIVGPEEAKQAEATVTPHTALAAEDRPTFPADLWIYIERLQGYCRESTAPAATAKARDALVTAAADFRELLRALEVGNAYLAADRAAACADTVANGIAALHLPRANGRYKADAGKRRTAAALHADCVSTMLRVYDATEGAHRTKAQAALDAGRKALVTIKGESGHYSRRRCRALLSEALNSRSGQV